MEGVQVYQRTVHTNGDTTNYTYLNMNGTWTDVTGRITVDKAESGSTYSMEGCVVQKMMFFQPVSMQNDNYTLDNCNSGYTSTSGVWAGDGAYNNLFAPGESRLIVLSGSWEADNTV
jgi:hypothetical protein